MNALELAEGLSKNQIHGDVYGLFNKRIQNMLRQQQTEIEALKLQLQTTLTNRNLRTYDGKASFNKENPVKEVFNTEPVAWMYETEMQDGTTVKRVSGAWECEYKYIVDACDRGYPTPLYTHPAKTLTDEEIHKIAQEHFHAGLGISPLDFARAILRKAQEK